MNLGLNLQLSPYGHRVHMALEETGAKYKLFIVDIMNKPAWYAERVNPAGKVSSTPRRVHMLKLTFARTRFQRSPTVGPRSTQKIPPQSL